MEKTRTRFDAVSRDYARFRPSYPETLTLLLRDRLAEARIHSRIWMDVGCGTGIFTRQLAEALPSIMRLIGIEPSAVMREKAERATVPGNIEYCGGSAEALPAAAGSICAVSAATAAHWFDRPRFYAEAVRVLEPGGLLVIVQYVRDLARSPAAADLDAYLNEMGGPKAYRRPDYAKELGEVRGLTPETPWSTTQMLRLDTEGYVGLALSSSHAVACIAKLGEARVRADLERLAQSHVSDEGLIPYGYRFDLVSARKTGSPLV